jgi:uncharacterized LabA/DUF88 family protein
MPEHSRSGERIAIFIDGWNFAKATYEGLGIRVDFKRLLALLTADRTLLRAHYYNGEWSEEGYALLQALRRAHIAEGVAVSVDPAESERRRIQQLGFIRMLNRNGFQVVRKPIRVLADGNAKAEIDVELAVDMLSIADRCDRVILVSGDADFLPLVQAVVRRGVRVQIIASQATYAYNTTLDHPRLFPARASDELLDAADEFTELKEIVTEIELQDPRRSMRPFTPIETGTQTEQLVEVN